MPREREVFNTDATMLASLTATLQALGVAIMGIGAVMAGGCNIGNSLTGMGVLSLTSLVATVFLILGTWSGTYLFFMRRTA